MVNLPQPIPKQFSSLMNDIERGTLKIPRFQRDFVWTVEKSAELLDSIVKGYPIGTFIFWKTKERFRSVRNIGNLELDEPHDGDYVDFVLDGQQRITSLFAALKGKTITDREGSADDFSRICVDLEAKPDEKIVTTEIDDKNQDQLIPLQTLLEGTLEDLAKYPQQYHGKISAYQKTISSYNYSVIQVSGVEIDVATDIFTRINVGGKPLTVFEIMVAKTYDHERDFDLAEKFDEFRTELEKIEYETISPSPILQLISIILNRDCRRKTILGLSKEEFIGVWDEAIGAVEGAIDYFRGHREIPASTFLPYDTLLVPFAYFFYKQKGKPSFDQQKYLDDFFWRTSLGHRYSSGVENKLVQDIQRIEKILDNTLPHYDWKVQCSPDDILGEEGWFSIGKSYIKAILCLYTSFQPRAFDDNSRVNVDNDWLKRSNSKNYHHFFPKSYLKKLNIVDQKINNVLNITIVDDYLNKIKIKNKPPSEYMLKFRQENPKLESTMKTHLIDDLHDFGIWDNDFDKFLKRRAEAVSREIEQRMIKNS